jgi:hypothetical protein
MVLLYIEIRYTDMKQFVSILKLVAEKGTESFRL